MKYSIELTPEQQFKPFSVTLTFETDEEYRNFHDKVMTNLKPNLVFSEFYGNIYRAGHGELTENVNGEVK